MQDALLLRELAEWSQLSVLFGLVSPLHISHHHSCANSIYVYLNEGQHFFLVWYLWWNGSRCNYYSLNLFLPYKRGEGNSLEFIRDYLNRDVEESPCVVGLYELTLVDA